MRVDSQELPLSAIPLCQLLPCHFGPPRPTLSINLYVKGCLDCTTGAFHMSIPSKSSLLQNKVRSSMPSRTSSSLDLVVTMSCGLTLWPTYWKFATCVDWALRTYHFPLAGVLLTAVSSVAAPFWWLRDHCVFVTSAELINWCLYN